MSRLRILLLGPMQAWRDDAEVALAYDKVRALLAFLAVERDRPHRREALAELLWPEQDERAARHSLSQALFSLRQSVGDRDAPDSLLLVTRETAQLNPAAGHWLDIDAFAALLDIAERARPRRPWDAIPERLGRSAARLTEQAVALYRGPLLDGLSVPDSAAFEEWLAAARERLQQRMVRALQRLVERHEWQGDIERACDDARRLLALDPWREDATRALMRMLAVSGRRAEALEQYERCARMLREELDLEPEPETTDLWLQIRAGRAHALPNRAVARGNVPASAAPLLGREQELDDARRLLDDDAYRLVTLAGPGGVGKTRLALRLASELAGTFAHGAWFVPLAGIDNPALLPHAIADALGVALDPRDDAASSLIATLRDRETLLTLDNFEHLLDAAPLLTRLLEQAPDTRLLVTSRERLSLRDEWVIDLNGLDLPADDDPASVEASGAAQLFARCARMADASWRLRPEDSPHLARLCRALDGIPLGIELAAAWVPLLSCREIAAEVEASLDFLSARSRDMPERHRSMRAVFDQSWGRLTPGERATFLRLSVFRGGFSRDAAERVAGASLPVLSALAAKSLVRRVGDGRFEIHELLRHYGSQRLAERPGDWRDAHDRHSDYYTGFVAGREARLKGPEQAAALAAISAEFENVRAAWGWAVRAGRPHATAAATHAFWLYAEITGRYHEAIEMVQQAARAFDSGDEGNSDGPRALALGRALSSYGSYFVRLGDYEQGRRVVNRAIDLLRPLNAPRDLALAFNFRAMYAMIDADARAAADDLRESIALFDASGDDWGRGYSLNDLGMATLDLGDADLARRHASQSLRVFRDLGDKRGMGFALHNLGVIALRQGDLDEARARHEEALDIRREINHAWGIAVSLVALGSVARAAGRVDESADYLLQALDAAVSARSAPPLLGALVEFAPLLHDAGEDERARDVLVAVASHPASDIRSRARAAEVARESGIVLEPAPGGIDPDDAALSVERHAERLRRERFAPSVPLAAWRAGVETGAE